MIFHFDSTSIVVVEAQLLLCEDLVEETWDGLLDAIDLSLDFPILCPFEIKGDGCPTEPYQVTSSNLYLLCEPSFEGTMTKGCVIDCPGLIFDVQSDAALTLDTMTIRGATNSAVRVGDGGSLSTFGSTFER